MHVSFFDSAMGNNDTLAEILGKGLYSKFLSTVYETDEEKGLAGLYHELTFKPTAKQKVIANQLGVSKIAELKSVYDKHPGARISSRRIGKRDFNKLKMRKQMPIIPSAPEEDPSMFQTEEPALKKQKSAEIGQALKGNGPTGLRAGKGNKGEVQEVPEEVPEEGLMTNMFRAASQAAGAVGGAVGTIVTGGANLIASGVPDVEYKGKMFQEDFTKKPGDRVEGSGRAVLPSIEDYLPARDEESGQAYHTRLGSFLYDQYLRVNPQFREVGNMGDPVGTFTATPAYRRHIQYGMDNQKKAGYTEKNYMSPPARRTRSKTAALEKEQAEAQFAGSTIPNPNDATVTDLGIVKKYHMLPLPTGGWSAASEPYSQRYDETLVNKPGINPESLHRPADEDVINPQSSLFNTAGEAVLSAAASAAKNFLPGGLGFAAGTAAEIGAKMIGPGIQMKNSKYYNEPMLQPQSYMSSQLFPAQYAANLFSDQKDPRAAHNNQVELLQRDRQNYLRFATMY